MKKTEELLNEMTLLLNKYGAKIKLTDFMDDTYDGHGYEVGLKIGDEYLEIPEELIEFEQQEY